MTYVFAIGRAHSDRDIVIVPAYLHDAEDAFIIGEICFDDGEACEPLRYFCSLPAIEDYINGWRSAQEAAGSDRDFGSIEDDHDFIRQGC